MSKWRPHPTNCIYVIPDIHGMHKELDLILNRILPLRKTDGCEDIIVFLGDYVDRLPDAHLVIDKLIELKKTYKNQVVCLRGNHEDMFLEGIKPSISSEDYLFWMRWGGEQTLNGYLARAGIELDNPYKFQRNRISGIVPKEHIEFLHGLKNYHEIDDFIFVHAGCDPTRPLDKQDQETFKWDRSICNAVMTMFSDVDLPWSKIMVTGHNGKMNNGKALVRDKFLMLDESCKKRLLVMEMRSRETFIAQRGKQRLVKKIY